MSPPWHEPRWTSHLGGSPFVRLHFAYDVVMSSLWHGESRLPAEVHRSGLSASRRACFRTAGLSIGRGTNSRRAPSSSASRRWTCLDCSNRITRGKDIATVVAKQSARGVVVAMVTVLRGGRLSERLSVTTSRRSATCCEPLGSDAMVVEESASAKTEEQDRLEALDASIVKLEKARGGKPDVAIDEVFRQKRLERQKLKDQLQSRKSSERRSRGTRKGGYQARGFPKGGDRSYAVVVKNSRRSRTQRTTPPRRRGRSRRSRRNVWQRSIAMGPSLVSLLLYRALRHCHRSSGLLDWRRRSQKTVESSSRSVQPGRFRGQGFSEPLLGGSEQGVSRDGTTSGSCLVDTDRDDINGVQLPCCQSSLPRAAGCAVCCGVSDEQESGAAAGS